MSIQLFCTVEMIIVNSLLCIGYWEKISVNSLFGMVEKISVNSTVLYGGNDHCTFTAWYRLLETNKCKFIVWYCGKDQCKFAVWYCGKDKCKFTV